MRTVRLPVPVRRMREVSPSAVARIDHPSTRGTSTRGGSCAGSTVVAWVQSVGTRRPVIPREAAAATRSCRGTDPETTRSRLSPWTDTASPRGF